MVTRTTIKTFAYTTFFLLTAMAILAACGGASTADSSTPSSGGVSVGGSGAGTPRAGNRGNRVSGTITSYDASAGTLTLKEANGTTQTFSTSKANLLKSQKITEQQLTTLLGKSGMTVMVTGQQASSGVYTAQMLVLTEAVNGQQPQGGSNGTPSAGVPPKGTFPQGTPQANGNKRVSVENGTLQNNQLVGKDRKGQAITVNLTGTTPIFQETVAAASDLQVGQTVTVMGAAAQNGGTESARQILIGEEPAVG